MPRRRAIRALFRAPSHSHFTAGFDILSSATEASYYIEMPDEEDIIVARAEYIRLAETLWHGTEPLAPAPMEDREIFELLGFD